MEINSTSKMMQRLNGGNKPSRSNVTPVIDECAETYEQNKKSLNYAPVPKTAAEMEQVLANSFANSYSKDHSPME